MAKTPQKRVAETKNEPEFDDPFIEEVVKRVRAVVGREQAAKVAAQIVSLYSEERFSGPIAHPRHLREYDEIVPGSADRIIQMAERSLSHSQDMQHKALQADIQDQKDGRK